jgi:hypothetical protein
LFFLWDFGFVFAISIAATGKCFYHLARLATKMAKYRYKHLKNSIQHVNQKHFTPGRQQCGSCIIQFFFGDRIFFAEPMTAPVFSFTVI